MATAANRVVLTLFTPAYNRVQLLPRLFDSIKTQVAPGDPVEWLVIDDGSMDGTAALLDRFATERPDLVRYLVVPNGGKHRAINRAAIEARGEWVMIVDSDDVVASHAIEQVRKTVPQVDGNAAIGVLRALKNFPALSGAHHFDVCENPCRYVAWCAQQRPFDSIEVVRRTTLQAHPFPDFSGERFMAEGWLWHAIDKTQLTFFINHPWVECFYQAEGLSANSRTIRAQSPCGAMAVYAAMRESDLPLGWQVRASINGWRYRFHANHLGKACDQARSPSLIFAPVGWVMYLADRRRMG